MFSFFFFRLIDTGETFLIFLAIIIAFNIAHDMMYGPQAAYFSELFGTRVRYSGRRSRTTPSLLAGGSRPSSTALLAANTATRARWCSTSRACRSSR